MVKPMKPTPVTATAAPSVAATKRLERPLRPVDAVVAQLRRGILDGELPADALLPPERELAASLGVSRLTLRAGLARLEAEGLLRAHQGRGVLVLPLERHASLQVLAHIDARKRPGLVADLLELRRMIASEAVAVACVRARPAGLRALETMARAQAAEPDAERYIAGDLAFSRRVLEITGNLALLLLLNSVEAVYRAHPEIGNALTADRATSLLGYDLVLGLLRAGDADAARTMVREALRAADDAVVARLESARRKPKGKSR